MTSGCYTITNDSRRLVHPPKYCTKHVHRHGEHDGAVVLRCDVVQSLQVTKLENHFYR